MPLKFAANISTLFLECESMVDRYCEARKYGFNAVECQFPYDCSADKLSEARADAQLEQVLINSFPGDSSKNEFGFALNNEKDFRNSLDITLDYARKLKCKKIHVIAGIYDKSFADFQELEKIYIKNLKTAADIFQQNDVIGLIEPICKEVKPGYFLSSFEQALKYLDMIGSPHLKLQMDVFHLQMIAGNLTNNIKVTFPHIGHVQISQAPNRNEPNSPGEINYRYVLSLLENLGYDGWIGLEYFATGSTRNSLEWIKEFGLED